MLCRKDVRRLIEEYQAAAPSERAQTELVRFREALLGLKRAPSRLAPPHTQASRYDDYVYVVQQSLSSRDAEASCPSRGGPAFLPWHRELLRQLERDLRTIAADPTLCIPYWSYTRDRGPSSPGFPFIEALLGGDGEPPDGEVQTGPFARVRGFRLTLDAEGTGAIARELGTGVRALPLPADEQTVLNVTRYDAAPWDRSVDGTASFRNLLEGWAFGPALHNRAHLWVGGTLLTSTAANDPVFFLILAKTDQLWATWMQRHPAGPHYLPVEGQARSGVTGLCEPMEGLAEYFGADTIERPIDLLDHKAIAWYDSDLPSIRLESGPALVFEDTPVDLTVGKLVRFRIASCRPVYFSITGRPTGSFSVVGGPDFCVQPQAGRDDVELTIEVRFHARRANLEVSAIDIEARILDQEGYYAATPGSDRTVGRFHVELVARGSIARASALALALDRSAAMAEPVSTGVTVMDSLKSALGVLQELMRDDDTLGMVAFDREVELVRALSPKRVAGLSLTGDVLTPRGSSELRGALTAGSALLGVDDAHPGRRALIVLCTEGCTLGRSPREGVPSGRASSVPLYAVGLGRAGRMADGSLAALAADSGGHVLFRELERARHDRFALVRDLVQVASHVAGSEPIASSQGILLWRARRQEFAFEVADADVSFDVIALCPLPFALDLFLVTPSGHVITRGMADEEPSVRYVAGSDVVCFRVRVPALAAQAAGSHRGTWRAVLALNHPQVILRHLRERRDELDAAVRLLREFTRKPVPYDLSIHAYSNLRLHVKLQQTGSAPGSRVQLSAGLTEYGLPFARPAQLVAEIHEPDGRTQRHTLSANDEGRHVLTLTPTLPGIHRIAVKAEGATSGNARFRREQVRTVSVWAESEAAERAARERAPASSAPEWLESLFAQLAGSRELRVRAKRLGIDLERLYATVRPRAHQHAPELVRPVERPLERPEDMLEQAPQLLQLLAIAVTRGVGGIPLPGPGQAETVQRAPRRDVAPPSLLSPRDPAPDSGRFVLRADDDEI